MADTIAKNKEYITGIKDLIRPVFENKKTVIVLSVKAILFGVMSYGSIEVIRQAVVRIESWNQQELLMFIYWWFVLIILRIIVTLMTAKTSRTAWFDFSNSIYSWIYSKFFTLDHQYLEFRGIGKISHLISDGAWARSNMLDRVADDLIRLLVSMLFALYYVWVFYGRRWVLISVLVIFGMSWVVIQVDHIIARIRKQRNKIFQENSRQKHKIVSNRFEIIQQWQQQRENNIVIDLQNQAKKKTEEFALYIVAYNSTNFISLVVEVWLYGMIGMQIILGNQNFAILTLMTVIVNRLFEQISTITNQYQALIDAKEKIDDMFSFLHWPQIIGYSTGSTFQPQWWSFDIRNMDYGYTDDQLIFSNFNLHVVGWSRIALVWPSGWGKTTLVKLIAGYLHPQSWEILVDWQALPTPQNCHSEWSIAEWKNQQTEKSENLDSSLPWRTSYGAHSEWQIPQYISLQSYYPHIWYLTQEPSVFDGTVWENLTYGLPTNARSDDKELETKINHIIKLARCEFIYEFKNGLQTEIGEKWIRLSWWQRQRLAIAKIMLKDPDIVLLDEPTSALDSENEELVTQALNELFRGKTVIVIAHRLQTVKHSDQILYIDGGQVIESWTHEELLAMKWKYYKMVELQSGF